MPYCGKVSFHLNFRQDAQDLMDIFNAAKTWPGSWQITGEGLLEVNVPSGNEQTGSVLLHVERGGEFVRQFARRSGNDDVSNSVEIFKVIDLGESITLPQYPRLQEWLGGKKLLTSEALAGHWIVKIGDQCGGYLAQSAPDGALQISLRQSSLRRSKTVISVNQIVHDSSLSSIMKSVTEAGLVFQPNG
jgi:hypothetical protein